MILTGRVTPRFFPIAPDKDGTGLRRDHGERIQNPLFFLIFLGMPVVTIAVAVLGVMRRGDMEASWTWWMLVVGSLVITAVANVPRNDALAALDPAAPGSAGAWADYVWDWARWNHVRGVLSVLATVCFVVAALGE